MKSQLSKQQNKIDTLTRKNYELYEEMITNRNGTRSTAKSHNAMNRRGFSSNSASRNYSPSSITSAPHVKTEEEKKMATFPKIGKLNTVTEHQSDRLSTETIR